MSATDTDPKSTRFVWVLCAIAVVWAVVLLYSRRDEFGELEGGGGQGGAGASASPGAPGGAADLHSSDTFEMAPTAEEALPFNSARAPEVPPPDRGVAASTLREMQLTGSLDEMTRDRDKYLDQEAARGALPPEQIREIREKGLMISW